jgi:hypothetical protein
MNLGNVEKVDRARLAGPNIMLLAGRDVPQEA